MTGGQSMNVAESLYQNVLNLFNDKYASLNYAEQIIEIVNKHLTRFGYPSELLRKLMVGS